MANYGTVQRPSALASSASNYDAPPISTGSPRKSPVFTFLHNYGIPSNPEVGAVRIVRNVGYFCAYYTLVVWLILFVSLIPRRRISLMYFVATTEVACFYLLLLRAKPDSVILHRIIDRRLVLALLVIVTVVELVLTHAIIHLLVSLAIGTPFILTHATLCRKDDHFVKEEVSTDGKLVLQMDKRAPDFESPA